MIWGRRDLSSSKEGFQVVYVASEHISALLDALLVHPYHSTD